MYGKYTADYRLKLEQANCVNKKFIAACHAFSEASTGSKQAIQDKMRRMMKLANPNLNEDQLDEFVRGGNIAQMTQIMTQMGDQRVNDAFERAL